MGDLLEAELREQPVFKIAITRIGSKVAKQALIVMIGDKYAKCKQNPVSVINYQYDTDNIGSFDTAQAIIPIFAIYEQSNQTF